MESSERQDIDLITDFEIAVEAVRADDLDNARRFLLKEGIAFGELDERIGHIQDYVF